VEVCFQSYGRDASGFTEYRPAKTAAVCLLAGSYAGECAYGAARDYANNYAGGRQAAGFCAALQRRLQDLCFEGVGTILGALHRSAEDRTAACRQIAKGPLLQACLRGAAVF
jgi:hypothetical protein